MTLTLFCASISQECAGGNTTINQPAGMRWRKHNNQSTIQRIVSSVEISFFVEKNEQHSTPTCLSAKKNQKPPANNKRAQHSRERKVGFFQGGLEELFLRVCSESNEYTSDEGMEEEMNNEMNNGVNAPWIRISRKKSNSR